MKLTPRLTLNFILYAATLLSVVGALAYNSGRNSLRTATFSELQATAIEKQAALNQWVEEKLKDITALSADPTIIEDASDLMTASPNSLEAQTAHNIFVAKIQPRVAAGEFLVVMLINPQTGEVIAATDASEEGKFQEDRLFFINGKLAPYVQNVYYSVTLQDLAMTASAPLIGSDGQLLGVLAGRIDLEEMNSIINRRSGLRATDDAFLVNKSNLFVTQPYLVSDPAVLQKGVHTEAVNRCLTRTSGAIEAYDYRGVPSVVTYRWLPKRELCLIVKIDQAEAYAPARAFGRTIAGISTLALLVAAGMAVTLSLSLARPIRALQSGAARFGQGELDARLPETSRDELGELAREFNQMAASLSEKDNLLRTYSFELEKRVEERTEEIRKLNDELEERVKLRTTQLEAANKELEAFSYSVSHDLRAPLRSIDGFSKILLEDYSEHIPAEGRQYLDRVRAAAQRMAELIDDLLNLARITRSPIQPQLLNLSKIAADVSSTLKQENPDRNLTVSITPDLMVNGDPALLKIVFENLLSNAWKFTSKKEQALIEFGVQNKDNEQTFFVRDNGAGFDMAYVNKLFGVFQRLHSVSEYPGTGVGLATVQRIIKIHGGRIWAEGEEGKGAAFYFTL